MTIIYRENERKSFKLIAVFSLDFENSDYDLMDITKSLDKQKIY